MCIVSVKITHMNGVFRKKLDTMKSDLENSLGVKVDYELKAQLESKYGNNNHFSEGNCVENSHLQK